MPAFAITEMVEHQALLMKQTRVHLYNGIQAGRLATGAGPNPDGERATGLAIKAWGLGSPACPRPGHYFPIASDFRQ